MELLVSACTRKRLSPFLFSREEKASIDVVGLFEHCELRKSARSLQTGLIHKYTVVHSIVVQ